MKVYCIDLDAARPEVLEFSGKDLEADLEYFGVSDPLKLSDPDRKIFLNERDAESYLKKFLETKENLDNRKICKAPNAPCMLYKRRYIVQSLLGEKMMTARTYRKNWKPGSLFNLHDQTYFLTVRLTRIVEKCDDEGIYYEYYFELP